MANGLAFAVIGAVFNLSRSHAGAPSLDVLDLIMKGRQG
jgi:hypothetical protein